MVMNLRRNLFFVCTVAVSLLLAGCERTPSIDVFGSFFPVWMICIAGGIFLTLAVRQLLVVVSLDKELGSRALVYTSMAFLFACVIWLAGFHD